MKKILIFSTAYYPFVGGAEVAVKEITDRIKDVQFNMITARMSRKLPKEENIGNIKVYRVGFGLPFFDKYFLAFFGASFAAKLYKKEKYDLVWSIMASYGGFATMFFKKKYPNIPFLLTLQEGDDFQYINKKVGIFKKWFKEIFIKADYAQCISNYLAKWAKDMGVKSEIEVVPNGVDIEKFSISDSQFHNFKKKLGIANYEKIIITSSRLVKKNAIDDIIKSLQYLNKNINFLILGSGPDLKKLKRLAKKLNVEKRVSFLGYVDHSKLTHYLKISDIFVRPSLSEGLGNSFLEAMASGLPVIATRVGGIPDFLKDNETGLFCEVHNPKNIAEKVKILLENNELREKIIKNSAEMVKNNYSWNLVAQKMNNIFNKII